MVFKFTEDQMRGSRVRRSQCGNQLLLMGHGFQWLFVSSYLVRAWWVLWETWPRQHTQSSSRPTQELSSACFQASVSAPGGEGAVVCSQEGDGDHNNHH